MPIISTNSLCLSQVDPPADVDPDSLNCVITYCKKDGVAAGEDILYQDILLQYTTVTSTCKAQNGSPGGKCGTTGPAQSDRKVTVEAKANPNYSAGARRRATEPVDRVISETIVWAQPPESQREHARDFPRDLSKRQTPPDSVSASAQSPQSFFLKSRRLTLPLRTIVSTST